MADVAPRRSRAMIFRGLKAPATGFGSLRDRLQAAKLTRGSGQRESGRRSFRD